MSRPLNEYDYLKVIATILVVIGHSTILYNSSTHPEQDTSIPQLITSGIYLFHMPLFMALSGAIYEVGRQRGKYLEFSSFAFDKVKRLLIPYLFVGLCFLIPATIFWSTSNQDPLSVNKLLLGHGCRHLWYLLALFEIFVFHWIAQKAGLQNFILLFGAILLSILFSLFGHCDLWCLNMAIYYYPFFLIGAIISKINKTNILYIGIIGALIMGCTIKSTHVYIVDIMASILLQSCLVITLIQTIRILHHILFKENELVKFLLKYSFSIYLFHVIVIYAVHAYFDLSYYYVIPIMILSGIVISVLISYFIKQLNGHILIGEKKTS